MKFHRTALLLIPIFLLSAAVAFGAEFRALRKIATPADRDKKDMTAVEEIVPVDRQAVETALRRVFAAWSQQDIAGFLSGAFNDADRLGDSSQSIPKDARIDILSISGIRTIGQYIKKPETGSDAGPMLVSDVSVTVRTQIVYNDVSSGYQRIEGSNEYILEVLRDLPR